MIQQGPPLTEEREKPLEYNYGLGCRSSLFGGVIIVRLNMGVLAEGCLLDTG